LHLTREEERILEDGKPAERKAMELLVAIGDIYGADKLIPISSVHISGASYKTIGEEGLQFIEEFSKDCKVKVKTTINPIGMDRKAWKEMGISEDFALKQERIIKAYEAIGVEESWTCTPYLIGNRPKPEEHISWAESSAVIFANSVLGARTNREGGPSALASSIIGLTPNYGLHLEENRKATILFDVMIDLEDEDLALLGCLAGEIARDGIPYFRGLRADEDQLKTLGAALGSTGSTGLFHAEGLTPEWERGLQDKVERVSVGRKELDDVSERLSTGTDPDLIAFGCPHSSLWELRRISESLEKKSGRAELWVCTSRAIRALGDRYAQRIERLGGKVICDTCMVVAPIEGRFSTVATNSGKASVYLPTFCKQNLVYANMETLLRRYA